MVLGFRCVKDGLGNDYTADADVDLSLDVLNVVYLLAECLRLSGLEIFAIEQAHFAHALSVRLAEPAGATGLLGLSVD
jgi:hypothetical protein